MERAVARLAGVRIHFTGSDRRGVPQEGTKTVLSVAVFVQDRYAAGWRDLVVRDAFGEPVGGIDRDDTTGHRVSWIEGTETDEARP